MTQPRSAARTRLPRGRRAWQAAAILTAGALTVLGLEAASAGASPPGGSYQQINMVSDQPGVAPLTDPDLVNAWGLSASPGTDAAPGSPLWVSDNGTDKTTLYQGATARTVTKVDPPIVDVTSGAPTGQVFNTDSGWLRPCTTAGHSAPAAFIFASENGGIDGWNPTVGSPSLPTTIAGDRGRGEEQRQRGLQRARHRAGLGRPHPTLRGQFPVGTGRSLRRHASLRSSCPAGCSWIPDPAGYAPFNVQELAGQLYVSYAKPGQPSEGRRGWSG